jgi:hypothetical protein
MLNVRPNKKLKLFELILGNITCEGEVANVQLDNV